MKLTLTLSIVLALAVACSTSNSNSIETTNNAEQIILRVGNAAFDSIIGAKTNIQLIDVRTPEEYSAGKIGNAQNLNILNGDFEKNMNTLDKQKPVAVYCRSGGRSTKARNLLAANGFSYIVELEKGYSNYK